MPFSHRNLFKIKDPVLYTIADRLSKLGYLNPTTTFPIIKKANDNKLLQAFTKKVGQGFQQLIGNKPFGLQDIIDFDKAIQSETMPASDYNLFNDSKVINHIHKDLDVWTGAQRWIQNLDNHVLQLNIDYNILKNITIEKGISQFPLIDLTKHNIEAYIKNSNHPTNKKFLTLSWVRFTILKPGYVSGNMWYQRELTGKEDSTMTSELKTISITDKCVVLDEIQTDLDDDNFLGKDLMRGWAEYTMRKFIYFVRGSLGVRKIYMPEYKTKHDLYSANPPMSLYKELPNKFGFQKKSDLPGFMLLEKNQYLDYKKIFI